MGEADMSANSVVFDLDGTLVDHQGASSSAIRAWMSNSGVSADAELARGVVEWARLERLHFSRYLAGEISFQDQRRSRISGLLAFLGQRSGKTGDDLFDSYLALYEAAWAPFDDVLTSFTVLEKLGYRICVFSNGQRAQQVRKLERTGLNAHVDGLITSGDLGVSKPDPAAFGAAWAALGIDQGRSWYVGDDLDSDARAASTAGIRGVWINRGKEPDGTAGVTEIRSLDELGRMLSP
jgi:putative hydrolase of the HAD superfamily